MRRVRAEVLNAKRVGAYHSITIVAPEVAERVRPGQFVSVAMPEGRTFLLRQVRWSGPAAWPVTFSRTASAAYSTSQFSPAVKGASA